MGVGVVVGRRRPGVLGADVVEIVPPAHRPPVVLPRHVPLEAVTAEVEETAAQSLLLPHSRVGEDEQWNRGGEVAGVVGSPH